MFDAGPSGNVLAVDGSLVAWVGNGFAFQRFPGRFHFDVGGFSPRVNLGRPSFLIYLKGG